MTSQTLADHIAANGSDLAGLTGPASHPPEDRISLRILGKFDLTVWPGRPIPLGTTSQRLLTLIALRSGGVPRAQAAGTLWPNNRSSRAAANLRSVLWRLQQTCGEVIDASFHDLRLAPCVTVDIHRSTRVAYELLDPSVDMGPEALRQAMQTNFYDDVAPDTGDDEWLSAERERFSQLRVHALESLASRLIKVGWHGPAIEAALGATRADPFRESAYRLLVQAHLAEGSWFEARRQHNAYRELLRAELGLTPSDEFMALLETSDT